MLRTDRANRLHDSNWDVMRKFCLIAVLLLTGCASVRDAVLQDKLFWRNTKEARHAWRQFYETRTGGDDDWASAHYEQGFIDGYVGVAMGATGCPPTLPPKLYWNPEYRTTQGKVYVTDWYNGYAEGAQAAKAAGAPDRNRVHTAIDVYGTGQSSYSSAMPSTPGGLTPVIPPEPASEAIDPAPGTLSVPKIELPDMTPAAQPAEPAPFGLSAVR